MIAGSLFSGIGGLDLGLERAGFRHAFFAEQDPWRRTVLTHHWPGVPVYDDVRAIGEPTGGAAVDGGGAPADCGRWEAESGLLSGGFPCQDVSVAGQRRGLAGARSGLFYEFARVIDALRPRWVLVENVPGLFSSNGGRDFGTVVGTLADLGYGVGWRVLDSRFFGVPQRRRRVFIVGAVAVGDPRAAAERAGQVLAVGARCQRHLASGGQEGSSVTSALAGRSASRLDDQGTGQLVAHALTAEGHDASEDGTGRGVPLVAATVRSHPRPGSNSDTGTGGTVAIAQSAHVRRLTPTECERLQALPDNWTNPNGDAPDSRRYAALGDAVTSSVGEWIGRRILDAETVSLEAVPPLSETVA